MYHFVTVLYVVMYRIVKCVDRCRPNCSVLFCLLLLAPVLCFFCIEVLHSSLSRRDRIFTVFFLNKSCHFDYKVINVYLCIASYLMAIWAGGEFGYSAELDHVISYNM